jgi:hypothetical protein
MAIDLQKARDAFSVAGYPAGITVVVEKKTDDPLVWRIIATWIQTDSVKSAARDVPQQLLDGRPDSYADQLFREVIQTLTGSPPAKTACSHPIAQRRHMLNPLNQMMIKWGCGACGDQDLPCHHPDYMRKVAMNQCQCTGCGADVALPSPRRS